MDSRINILTRGSIATAAAGALMVSLLATTGASAASPVRWAVVDGTGALVRDSGALSSARLGAGRYQVKFSSAISSCAYVATTENAYSQALRVSAQRGPGSSHTVYVETKNQGGGLTDGPFQLAVACGGSGIKYAVVGGAGGLARASAGTSITSPGTGRYRIKFNANIRACAYVASTGDPGAGIYLGIGNVSTGSGPSSSTVYVETKNSGGGLAGGVPFHLIVACPGAASTEDAVVRANGFPARSSGGTSSLRMDTGLFVLATDRNLKSCAVIATRGSVDTLVPFTPTTVELDFGGRLSHNAVLIRVRGLLALGDSPTSQAFHAAVFC